MEIFNAILDIGLGLAAFRLAWSVDRTQKEMLKVQAQQAQILSEFSVRLANLETEVKVLIND